MSKTKMKAETSSGIDIYVSWLTPTKFYLYVNSDLEQSLLSTEKLDRASPDIWPERNCNRIKYKKKS